MVASSSSASVALASAFSWASSLTKPKCNPLYLSASQEWPFGNVMSHVASSYFVR